MLPKTLTQLTRLPRDISPRYTTHKMLLTCLLGVLLLAFSYTFNFLLSLHVSLLFFLSWALTRELVPDLPWVAFVAMIFTYLILSFEQLPSLSFLFVVLLLMRVVNQSACTRLTWFDKTITALGISWLGWVLLQAPQIPPLPATTMTILTALFFFFVQKKVDYSSLKSDDKKPLSRFRIQLGQLLFVTLTILSFITTETQLTGVLLYSVLVGATVGVLLQRFWIIIRKSLA